MSEEILKALTQLFAIITKQDEGVTEVERKFVEQFFIHRLSQDAVKEYISLYEEFLVDKKRKERPSRRSSKTEDEQSADKKDRRAKLTSMKDSVRTLAICKKINKTLTQKQKVIVLLELLELVNSDKNFSPQRKEILNTVSTVFNIEGEEYKIIEKFVTSEDVSVLDYPNIILSSHEKVPGEKYTFIHSDNLDGHILILHVASVDLYFVRYAGEDEIILNSQVMFSDRVYLYSSGSTLKTAKSAPLYYSDVVTHLSQDADMANISFSANNLQFKFPNGHIGLRDVNISESRGSLIGIMGASGAGKTTLLNVLAGIESPSDGEVLINSINIHKNKDKIEGVIGYISQDDILIEDLTVFENLYFNAKLCFSNKTEDEMKEIVMKTLENLGLHHIKDLKVGNVLNKKISGGQRKRLNIALELIREPAIMFVDEPTSGLSSRDSENVIDLLKELSLKGKLIFVVIHQPSSDIYKKFDKMFMMDTGGYPIYYGSPVEAIIHFKTATNQINSKKGQCGECGNVNPEQIFDIVEAQVVNEYGQETGKRKVIPTEWNNLYKESHQMDHVEDFLDEPPNSLSIPHKLKQWLIYVSRDIKSKISNKQYLIINLLEAPVLALVLALLIRYNNAPDESGYIFKYNENFPAYILMSIVIALFMGLTVSAEEIIKDRKILKREQFLNLSRSSYLMSKVGILFSLSAIQTISFVMIGNLILGIPAMYWQFWLVLFSTSCFANVLGLNISSSFNSAVTVYIVIPLLLIPQMVLSGALFSFEKLHDVVASKGKTPFVADIMASRWAYEALAVEQYKSGPFNKLFYEYKQQLKQSEYMQLTYLPELKKLVNESIQEKNEKKDEAYTILKNEVAKLTSNHPDIKIHPSAKAVELSDSARVHLHAYFQRMDDFYGLNKALNQKKKDKTTLLLEKALGGDQQYQKFEENNFNENLEEVVRNVSTQHKILRYDGQLIRFIDPIFNDPIPSNALDYRAQFFSPKKHFLGMYVDTFIFNILVIWGMSLILYLSLYFDLFRKTFGLLEKLSFKKSDF